MKLAYNILYIQPGSGKGTHTPTTPNHHSEPGTNERSQHERLGTIMIGLLIDGLVCTKLWNHVKAVYLLPNPNVKPTYL